MPNARPAVFIGAGGAGTFVLAHLKKRLEDYYGKNSPDFNKLQFLALDTSRSDFSKLQAMFGKDLLKENEDWFSLGDFNPYQEFSEYRRIIAEKRELTAFSSLNQWLDLRAGEKFSNHIVDDGASADRQQGRLSYWKRADNFKARLTEKITAAHDALNAQAAGEPGTRRSFEVYLISGTNGGTGSSILLDLCYGINETWSVIAGEGEGEPRIRAVLFLPFRYVRMYENEGPSLIARYKANGFAFFEELEYLFWDRYLRPHDPSKPRGMAFHSLTAHPERTKGNKFPFRPFQLGLLVDDKTQDNSTIADRDLYPSTATALFHLFVSSSTASLDSVYNNVEADIQALDPAALKFGTFPGYALFGYRSVEYPKDLLVDYCKSRFTYEALRYGLLRIDDTRQEDVARAVSKSAQEIVYAQLFESGAPPEGTCENFERNVRVQCASLEGEVGLSEFCKDLEGDNEQPKIDKDKVTEEGLKTLTAFAAGRIEFAKTIIDAELLRLRSSDDPSYGCPFVAKKLGDLIDELAPVRGISHVNKILATLDVVLTQRYTELEKVAVTKAEEANAARDQAVQLTEQVLKKPSKHILQFRNLLRNFVRLKIDERICNAQLTYLKDVSKEDSTLSAGGERKTTMPLVDQAKEQANKINTTMTGRCLAAAREQYKVALPKEFHYKEQDVFTAYVPAPSSLLEPKGLGDVVYGMVVDSSIPEKLGQLIQQSFSSKTAGTAALAKAFFLSQCHARGEHEESTAWADDLLSRLSSYCVSWFTSVPKLRDEVNKSLWEVLMGLPVEERQKIIATFKTVQTFGKIDEARADYAANPGETYMYQDDRLGSLLEIPVQKLNKGRIPEGDPGRIVVFQVKYKINKEAVAGLLGLESAYKDRNHQTNLPHISRAWNDFGPKEAEKAKQVAERLALGMVFHRLVRKLVKDKSGRIAELLYAEDSLSSKLQQDGPIYLDSSTGTFYGYQGERIENLIALKDSKRKALAKNKDYAAACATLGGEKEILQTVADFQELLEKPAWKQELDAAVTEMADNFRKAHDTLVEKNPTDRSQDVLAAIWDSLQRYKKKLSGQHGDADSDDGLTV